MLVAIPCHLEGVLNYARTMDKEILEKIACICGIVCGWMYSHHSLAAFARYNGIDSAIEDATYRGGDRVGKLRFMSGGKSYAFERRHFSNVKDLINYQSSFSTDYNRLRCRVCEDHLNMLADVIAGDAWLERTKTEKISVIATRTEVGDALIANLANKGKIELEAGSFEDLIESQSSNLVLGTKAREINAIMREQGKVTPTFHFADVLDKPIGDAGRKSFSHEMKRRGLIRNRHYLFYRLLYVFRRWRPIASHLRRALKGA